MLEAAAIHGRLIDDILKGPTAEERALADVIVGGDWPIPVHRAEIAEDLLRFVTEYQLVPRPDGEKANTIRQQLTTLEAGAPVERAMAVRVSAKPFEPRILLRGEPDRRGPAVPRRFPQVLAEVDDRTYSDDGRLRLAQDIASGKNPLTARVIVNRVWQHHFGKGLVATPDNFGSVGDRPSHPELLDYLARVFMRDGWSIKKLHQRILLSATWQQSAQLRNAECGLPIGAPPALAAAIGMALPFNPQSEIHNPKWVDPDNRLLWRMPPRRLEFEPLRDALLQAAGRLDTRMGGRMP